VSRPEATDEIALRARLLYIAVTHDVDGSAYMRTLGALLLSCDEESEQEAAAVEALFDTQATIEGVDGDAVLVNLCMAVPSTESEVPS
jgi:hypothetical protein